MAEKILKPLSDEELKVRVGEFINSFIDLNRKNQASFQELKESYHEADLMLYQILRSSNGIVNSIRLIDMIQTLVLNYMLENINLNGEIRGINEPDRIGSKSIKFYPILSRIAYTHTKLMQLHSNKHKF